MKKLKIVKVDSAYCDYLRQYDNLVSYNKGRKENRPFIGVIFKIDSFLYFAPLSSPKPKHLKLKNNIDCMKIDQGKLGVVNLNNMIPLFENNYEIIDLDKKSLNNEDQKYINLLKHQHEFLSDNFLELQKKSKNLYKIYCNGNINAKLKNRCCNYPLLEEKCLEYNKL